MLQYITKSIADDTMVKHPKVIKQAGESDFKFLERLAKENYYEFFVSGETLYFRQPIKKKNEILWLHWSGVKFLLSFHPEINLANQITEVEVRGWDPKTKKEIVGKAQTGDEVGRDPDRTRKSGGDLVREIFKKSIVELIHTPFFLKKKQIV